MKNQFELAGGSVVGREHLRVGKNNQDAYCWSVTEAIAVAVVCDGCGSGVHSEVGAKLGARMTVEAIQNVLSNDLDLDKETTWQIIQQALLTQLQQVVEQLGGDRAQAVQDYLLFTIVGAVMTSTLTTVFALGDGVIVINDQVIALGPFANNAPPYLAYRLLTEEIAAPLQLAPLQLKVLQVLPTEHLQSLCLGSDGVSDLIQVAKQPLPGRSEVVGDIAQFWQDDRYFRNPDQVRRRLSLINREVTRVDNRSQACLRQSGLLPDDTTLIVIRKKEGLC